MGRVVMRGQRLVLSVGDIGGFTVLSNDAPVKIGIVGIRPLDQGILSQVVSCFLRFYPFVAKHLASFHFQQFAIIHSQHLLAEDQARIQPNL